VKRSERRRLQREQRAAAALAAERSLVHTSVDSFDRDDRVGAVLVNRAGQILCRRVPPPTRRELRSRPERDPLARPPAISPHTGEPDWRPVSFDAFR
jgi:hypothetical protein